MILLVSGLIGLWIGTKWIIRAAVGIAQRFHLSHAFVGMAILAVGTDLPEVFVSLKASTLQLQGIESSGIITGNAIGSSFCQITVILGISGLFANFKTMPREWLHNAIALVASIVLLFVFGMDGTISRLEGGMLLGGYLLYYVLLVRHYKNEADDNASVQPDSNTVLLFFLVSGLSVLIFASHLVVTNAMVLAEKWGIAQSFIGIAIIGLGTSLPELAVSVGAALRNSIGMSVGNILGSNIFDSLVPIGLGGLIGTTTFERSLLQFDLPALLTVTLLALVFLRSKKGMSMLECLFLILLYLAYILLKLFL
jgi:cation:H+ antiporter